MPRSPKPPPALLSDYGCPIDFPSQSHYDQWAFAQRVPVDQGAPRRPDLFRRIAEDLLPGHFEWHDWTNRMIEALCDVVTYDMGKAVNLVGFPGCASAGKTYHAVGFAVIWWLCNPENSSVTFVSTTVKSLRRRGWAEVQRCYDALGNDRPGNFVDSRLLWQWERGNDKCAIIGRAVEEGATHKVADDIKGVHTTRQMVIIDEATAVPEAIYEACANLYSYPDEFILVTIGNPRNRLDSFGRFCEPEDGWLSVGVDTGEWTAKPYSLCGGAKPNVITFDAEKSPNIIHGRTVSRHLPTLEEVESAKRFGGGQTPHYWQNKRGFWPPEGLVKTVFTESALITFDGYGHHKFTGENFTILGAFDPAFGGDRAALRFARMGEIEGGMWGIQVMPPIIVPVDAASKNPIHYQLAEQVRRECERITIGEHRFQCPPENLGVDDTGEGGFCDVVYRNWSQKVIRIEFGGSPSSDPCSLEDFRPANEVYLNKRVEMAFRSRDALNSRQLKGIDPDTAVELCSIEFDDITKAKIVLMSKKDYRLKFHKSPDLADTLFILLEVARQKGFKLAAMGETAKAVEETSEIFEAQQRVYQNIDFSEDEIEEPVM